MGSCFDNFRKLDAENALGDRHQAESQNRDRDTDNGVKQNVSRFRYGFRIASGGDEQDTGVKTHQYREQTDKPGNPVNQTHDHANQSIGIGDVTYHVISLKTRGNDRRSRSLGKSHARQRQGQCQYEHYC